MTKLTLRLAASLLPLIAIAAAPVPPGQRVTPMTPDVVATYNPVLPEADYIKRVAMVPMRDGTKLYTVIVMKKGTRNGPILLSRTPYDAKGSMNRETSQSAVDILPIMYKEFVNDGYIIVQQDIRGLHNSEGQFVMNRPIAGPLNPTGIDESTDAYDAIDWLVKNVPESNGKVGTIGSSYLGFRRWRRRSTRIRRSRPRCRKARWSTAGWATTGSTTARSAPAASISPSRRARQRPKAPGSPCGRATIIPAISRPDRWPTLPGAGDRTVIRSSRSCSRTRPTPNSGRGQAVDKWMAARPLTVPTLLEVGQWDQEDSYGAPAVYKALKDKYEGSGLLHLAIGPWRHSGANHYGYELGDLTFTGDTATEWRVKWVKPFFDHYLKGAPIRKRPTC